MSGLPRYLAAARADDAERLVRLAEEQFGDALAGPVLMLQVGRASVQAAEMSRELDKRDRRSVPLVIADRDVAQSAGTLTRVASAGAVWVFADDLLEAFMTLFATELAFHLRSRAGKGLPVLGVGGGAVSLGGLLLATRVCAQPNYDLVAGLGWAQRVFIDTNVVGQANDDRVARATVQSLPGLLGVQLGEAGAIRAEGGRIESVGSQPILMMGANGDGTLMQIELDPGRKTTIAPPPFAPFDRRLLPPETLRALSQPRALTGLSAVPPQTQPSAPAPPAPPVEHQLRQAPPPEPAVGPIKTDTEARPGGGRYCPMCKTVHGGQARVELAA
ncbi:MAG: hypothetical protein M3336_02315 [Chloroflexota bacterium]|nr:hypothetical protein [Chloroflexota bacterium]